MPTDDPEDPTIQRLMSESEALMKRGVKVPLTVKAECIRPLHDRVLLRVEDSEVEQVGEILIPQVGRTRLLKGTIIRKGEGTPKGLTNFIPLQLQVGDCVIYHKLGGYTFDTEDGPVRIIKERDVLAVL